MTVFLRARIAYTKLGCGSQRILELLWNKDGYYTSAMKKRI